MPWPMVHFSIAHRIFDRPHPAFLLGSIAPDAVQVRENHFSAKAKSHLNGFLGEFPVYDGLIQFYEARINSYIGDEFNHFLLGYISHIISDQLWGRYKRDISGGDKEILHTLWQEENQYDFNLYYNSQWSKTTEKQVKECNLFVLSDMYTEDELNLWREQLFNWLISPENEPCIQNQHQKRSNVEHFIDLTAMRLVDWFNINNYL